MLRIFNLQTKHFLIKNYPQFCFQWKLNHPTREKSSRIHKTYALGSHQLFYKNDKTENHLDFSKKFIGANSFMENLEIKCSQLCFKCQLSF